MYIYKIYNIILYTNIYIYIQCACAEHIVQQYLMYTVVGCKARKFDGDKFRRLGRLLIRNNLISKRIYTAAVYIIIYIHWSCIYPSAYTRKSRDHVRIIRNTMTYSNNINNIIVLSYYYDGRAPPGTIFTDRDVATAAAASATGPYWTRLYIIQAHKHAHTNKHNSLGTGSHPAGRRPHGFVVLYYSY